MPQQCFQGFNRPGDVAFAHSGAFALVANFDSRNIGRIDFSSGTISFPYNLQHRSLGIAISRDDSFVLFTTWDGLGETGPAPGLCKIDLASGHISVIYSRETWSHGVAISPNMDFALITDQDAGRQDGKVLQIDLNSGSVTRSWSIDCPRGVDIAPDGSFALVPACRSNSVARIDLSTGQLSYPYSGFDNPSYVSISPDGKFALVSNLGHTGRGTLGIGRIDLQTGQVSPHRYKVGFPGPLGVDIEPEGRFALVSHDPGPFYKILDPWIFREQVCPIDLRDTL